MVYLFSQLNTFPASGKNQPCSRSRSPLPLGRSPRFLNSWCIFLSLSFLSGCEMWTTCLHFSFKQPTYLRRGTAPRCLGCCWPVWERSSLSSCQRIVFSESEHQAKSKQPRFANSWSFSDQALSRSLKNWHIEARSFYSHTSGSMCRFYACYGSKKPKEGLFRGPQLYLLSCWVAAALIKYICA